MTSVIAANGAISLLNVCVYLVGCQMDSQANDPDLASWRMRARYGIARRIYGEYPPHAGLNYIWANRQHDERILPSPYTERTQLVILREGGEQVGEWIEEEVNILADYRRAFGEYPPREARIAFMSDADDTGESAVGYIDFVELR